MLNFDFYNPTHIVFGEAPWPNWRSWCRRRRAC